MKQTALVSLLWPKSVPVLEQYLATRPRIVLTLRGAITVELRRLVSAVGGTVVALEELLDAGEIHTIGQKAAAVNRDASRAMSEQLGIFCRNPSPGCGTCEAAHHRCAVAVRSAWNDRS